MNRVILAPLIGLGLVGLIVIVIICGGLLGMSMDTLVASLLLWSLLLLIILWSSKDQFWIYRKLPAMTPNHYKTVNVFLQKNKATLRDEDSGIKYEYNVKKKELSITRNMFTDPQRYVEEYEERKRQFELVTERIGISHLAFVAKFENSSSFLVSIILSKSCATPENISKCRDTFIELAKDDYNQNLYAKFQFDDDWLYVETYHYRLLRAMLVSADGTIECASPDVNTNISIRFSSVLNKAAKISILDNVKPSDIIEQKVFEDLWEENTHCADIQP